MISVKKMDSPLSLHYGFLGRTHVLEIFVKSSQVRIMLTEVIMLLLVVKLLHRLMLMKKEKSMMLRMMHDYGLWGSFWFLFAYLFLLLYDVVRIKCLGYL